MGCGAHVKKAETQEKNKTPGTPNKTAIVTTETLELLLKKLPEAARKALRVPRVLFVSWVYAFLMCTLRPISE